MANRRTAVAPLFLLSLVVSFGLHASPLRVGVLEGAKFGYGYDGVDTNRESASFEFARHPTDLTLSYVAYDIDVQDEVAIEVNGRVVGQVVATANEATDRGEIVIGSDLMVDGENTIVFRQRVPGYVWGVTDLRLESDSLDAPARPLVLGVTDDATYGFRYDGQNDHREGVGFEFPGGFGGDVRLHYTGYDIDVTDEVAVELNGTVIGHLAFTGDEMTRDDFIVLPAARLVGGTNSLVLRHRIPGYIWGVTGLRLEQTSLDAPVRRLTIDVADDATYGFRHDGQNDHREGVGFEFLGGSGDDLVLYYTAHDIDVTDEVAVELNGAVVGHLAFTGDGTTRDDFIVLPAARLVGGTNSLVLRHRIPGYVWGVTSLLLAEYWCP